MSKIKLLSVLAIALCVVLVLTSCNFTPGSLTLPTSTSDPNAATAEPVEPTPSPTPLTQKAIVAIIRLWHDWQGADATALDQVLALFKAEYPNVIIKLTSVPTAELKAKFEGASTTADLILGPTGWGKEWLDAYIIQDITLMVASETGWAESWTPEALATCTSADAMVSSPVFGLADSFEVAYLTQEASYQNKTAALELMKFLTRPNIQKIFTDAGHKSILKAQ
jgi:ABC-type glycerol-3-phosphate transport system substrate-binding protein